METTISTATNIKVECDSLTLYTSFVGAKGKVGYLTIREKEDPDLTVRILLKPAQLIELRNLLNKLIN